MALLRPSELARLWGLHPSTVNGWIHEGRLPAIRTPGAQFRVREADARAYCKEHGLPVPRGVQHPGGAVVLLGAPSPTQRAIARACKAREASVTAWTNVLDGLIVVGADPPDVIAIDAATTSVRALDLVRALRRHERTASVPVVVHDAPPRSAGLKLGPTVALSSDDAEGAVRAMLDLLDQARAKRR